MKIIFVVVIFIWFVWTDEASAYLDPGTGSVFLQMLIAGIVSAMFALKMFWRRIVGFFNGLFKGKNDDEKN